MGETTKKVYWYNIIRDIGHVGLIFQSICGFRVLANVQLAMVSLFGNGFSLRIKHLFISHFFTLSCCSVQLSGKAHISVTYFTTSKREFTENQFAKLLEHYK